jgi:N-acetylated-alpha-linked acidic dipeptidase
VRLADSDVLPFEFTGLSNTVEKYVKELTDLLSKKREDVRERNRQIDDGVFAALSDPRHPLPPPKAEPMPPALNFAPLENAAAALTASARRYEKALAAGRERVALNTAALRMLNAKLRQAEPQLIDAAGLPNRPWYRHLLYAPGLYTGYSVKTIPGVREGIEQAHYAEAESEVVGSRALTRLLRCSIQRRRIWALARGVDVTRSLGSLRKEPVALRASAFESPQVQPGPEAGFFTVFACRTYCVRASAVS